MKITVNVLGTFLVAILTFTSIALLGGYPTKWIVNYLFTPSFLTTVFGVTKLTFWNAFWLNSLCSVLFKSNTLGSK